MAGCTAFQFHYPFVKPKNHARVSRNWGQPRQMHGCLKAISTGSSWTMMSIPTSTTVRHRYYGTSILRFVLIFVFLFFPGDRAKKRPLPPSCKPPAARTHSPASAWPVPWARRKPRETRLRRPARAHGCRFFREPFEVGSAKT